MTRQPALRRLTIAVSGSRTVRNAGLVSSLLDERAIHYISSGYELHWHLGDAQGVDSLALLWARDRSMAPRTVFFADIDRYGGFLSGDIGGPRVASDEFLVQAADWSANGRAAGAIRNGAMLRGVDCPVSGCRGADLLLAIWDGASPGTLNCRMQARALNVACQTYLVPAGEWDESPSPMPLTPVRD